MVAVAIAIAVVVADVDTHVMIHVRYLQVELQNALIVQDNAHNHALIHVVNSVLQPALTYAKDHQNQLWDVMAHVLVCALVVRVHVKELAVRHCRVPVERSLVRIVHLAAFLDAD